MYKAFDYVPEDLCYYENDSLAFLFNVNST